MKIKSALLVLALLSFVGSFAQLSEENAKNLEIRKNNARQNSTTLWMYDTVYRLGEPYCLLKNRLISDEGNEYVVNSLKNQEVIYIIEPSDIKKLIGKISGDANVEFSFIKERQKLNVPKKSIKNLPDFIVDQDLVTNNAGNMVAVKKLLFVYSNENPQGYTANVNQDSLQVAMATADSIKKIEQVAIQTVADTSKYQPVIRNKKSPLVIENYMIRQDGVLIGRYDKSSRTDGGADNKTVYTFKSPDWKEIAIATNGGVGSASWDIFLPQYKKRDSFRTSLLPNKALKELVEYLVANNYL